MYTNSNDYKYLINQLIKKNVFGNNLSEDDNKRGGVLELLTTTKNFDSIDPSIIYTGRDLAVFSAFVYRTLVTYKFDNNGNYSLIPDLATDIGSYNIINDHNNKPIKSSWTFTLKNNIKFEDGTEITCEHLKICCC